MVMALQVFVYGNKYYKKVKLIQNIRFTIFSLLAIGEFITSSHYYTNIHVEKFNYILLSCTQ